MYLFLLPHYTHIARPILTKGILLMHERVHIAILTRWQYIQLQRTSKQKKIRDRPLRRELAEDAQKEKKGKRKNK